MHGEATLHEEERRGSRRHTGVSRETPPVCRRALPGRGGLLVAAAALLVLGACSSEVEPLLPAPRPECFRVADPYAVTGAWYRGNFHMYSEHSDGSLDAAKLVDLYQRNGYTVLCVSDHDQYGNQDGGIMPHYQTDGLLHDWNGDGVLHPDYVFGSGVEAYARDWSTPPAGWILDNWYHDAGSKQEDALVMLTGAEMTRGGFHIGLVGTPAGALEPPNAPDAYIERTHAAGGFVALEHPGEWNGRPGQLARTLDMRRFDAVEIMNGLRLTRQKSGLPVPRPAASGVPRDADLCAALGPADATPVWDGLLSRGYRLWGIADDDCHTWQGAPDAFPFTAFDMIRAATPSTEDFLAALQVGSFYGSTGLFFRDLRADGDSVIAWAPGAHTLRFIGWGGQVLQRVAAERAAYPCDGSEGYVRVEATGAPDPEHGWPMQAWSQPFFIESAPCTAVRAGDRDGG